MTAYASVADLAAYYPGTTSNATHATLCLETASRWLEKYCNQMFNAVTSTRTFEPQDLYVFNLDRIVGDGIASTSSLVVKTDSAGDGTFETTWAASDYELLPYNAPSEGPEPKPWTALRAVGTKTFPLLVATALTRRDRIQITASWGWPSVPSAVSSACLIQAARLYSRTKSPDGVAGFGENVALRVSNQLDPDVAALVNDYRRGFPLVA